MSSFTLRGRPKNQYFNPKENNVSKVTIEQYLEERKKEKEKENASANANKNSIYDRRKSFAKGKKKNQ